MAITRIGKPAIADVRGVNFRNICQNGDMSIAQRGTSSTNVSTGYHTCDRYKIFRGAGTITMSQETDAPTGSGFVKSLKFLEAGSGSSPSAGDRNFLQHKMEGQNLQYIKKGTSSAEKLTLSFHVKSTVTGTYIAELYDEDNTRQVSKAYTISSANTWEYKTITFPADTSGTLDNDNANSMNINLYFTAGSNFTSGTLNTTWNSVTDANRAVGQVNVVASANGAIQWTGIQLEAGSQASDFEFLPIDVNLERCKRYFQTKGTSLSPNAFSNNQTVAMGLARTVSQAQCYMELNPIMRSEPTVSGIGTLSNLKCHTATGGNVNTSSIGSDGTPNRQQVTYLANNLTSGLNNNEPIRLYGDYTITFDAEL
jgi:hypothetical protein